MLAALVIATGAAAGGLPVTMFFAFWGITALRRERAVTKKQLVERALGFMLPKGTKHLPLSRLHMGGAGAAMIRSVMKKSGGSPRSTLNRQA